jgi:uncharacterized protein YciI
MLFAAICTDKPNAFEQRAQLRPAHFAFLEARGAQVKIAGPFLDAEGRMTGSLLLIDAADEAAARALLTEDPYAQGGLFAQVDLRAWRCAVGDIA